MKNLIMLMLLLFLTMISSHPGSEGQRSDSYLGIYCSLMHSTTGSPRYDEPVTYGEHNELAFKLSVVHEEGGMLLFLPEDFTEHLVIELTKDEERLPVENLDVQVSTMETKYAYDPRLSEQDYDPDNFQVLEPGIGLRTSFILKRRDGTPFPYGFYKLICYFKRGSVKFEDGTDWQGRGGRGGAIFRILRVESPEDQRGYYIIKGGEYLQKNQPERALEVYQKLIELEPENISNYAWLGATYMHMEKYREAIVAYEKALPAYIGERTSIPYELAFCYVAVNREEKAREVLKKFFGELHIEETIRRIKMVLEKKRGRHKKK